MSLSQRLYHAIPDDLEELAEDLQAMNEAIEREDLTGNIKSVIEHRMIEEIKMLAEAI